MPAYSGFGALTPFGGSRSAFDELASLQSKISASMPQQICVDIVEKPAGYELVANVPGYKKVRRLQPYTPRAPFRHPPPCAATAPPRLLCRARTRSK